MAYFLHEKQVSVRLYGRERLNVAEKSTISDNGNSRKNYCILHELSESFDYNLLKDVRGIFLDLSKAFDRVWHDGLIYKIKCIGITGNTLKHIESFLSSRFQWVVLN